MVINHNTGANTDHNYVETDRTTVYISKTNDSKTTVILSQCHCLHSKCLDISRYSKISCTFLMFHVRGGR